MPYISRTNKLALGYREPINAGELQYEIAMLINSYLQIRGDYRYQELNDVMGALAGAQQEFYRRIVVPYEDQKRKENGDVYETKQTQN